MPSRDPDDLLNRTEVMKWLGYERTKCKEIMDADDFPEPVLDFGRPRWLWRDLVAWLAVERYKLRQARQAAKGGHRKPPKTAE
jgi:predicted DNA-binding transcriptional regulator AlpA